MSDKYMQIVIYIVKLWSMFNVAVGQFIAIIIVRKQ